MADSATVRTMARSSTTPPGRSSVSRALDAADQPERASQLLDALERETLARDAARQATPVRWFGDDTDRLGGVFASNPNRAVLADRFVIRQHDQTEVWGEKKAHWWGGRLSDFLEGISRFERSSRSLSGAH